MWFVFPQLRGLGRSPMATYYGIGSLDEARAYLAHPLLGPRLDLCTNAVLEVERRTPHEIFGSPDDMKFHSSMSLFALAAADGPVRTEGLDRWWEGKADAETLRLLGSQRINRQPGGLPRRVPARGPWASPVKAQSPSRSPAPARAPGAGNWRECAMRIVDAQIHTWGSGLPSNMSHGR